MFRSARLQFRRCRNARCHRLFGNQGIMFVGAGAGRKDGNYDPEKQVLPELCVGRLRSAPEQACLLPRPALTGPRHVWAPRADAGLWGREPYFWARRWSVSHCHWTPMRQLPPEPCECGLEFRTVIRGGNGHVFPGSALGVRRGLLSERLAWGLTFLPGLCWGTCPRKDP